jgi:hypothetical protein
MRSPAAAPITSDEDKTDPGKTKSAVESEKFKKLLIREV